jgi:hypothetical protein
VQPLLPIIPITGHAEARVAADLPGDAQLSGKPFRACASQVPSLPPMRLAP